MGIKQAPEVDGDRIKGDVAEKKVITTLSPKNRWRYGK